MLITFPKTKSLKLGNTFSSRLETPNLSPNYSGSFTGRNERKKTWDFLKKWILR